MGKGRFATEMEPSMLQDAGRFKINLTMSRQVLRTAIFASTDLMSFVITLVGIACLFRIQWASSSISSSLFATVLASIMIVQGDHITFRGIRAKEEAKLAHGWHYFAVAVFCHFCCIAFFNLRDWPLLLVWFVFPVVSGGPRNVVGRVCGISGFLPARTVLAGSPAAVAAARYAVDDRVVAELEIGDGAVPPNAAEWLTLLARHDAEGVVVALQGNSYERSLMQSLQHAGVPATRLVSLDDAGTPFHTWGHARVGIGPIGRSLKSLVDFCVSLMLLIAFSPAILLLAAVVKLDGGPILFKHERVGLRGRMFHCLKFRTMVPNGDRLLQELLERDPVAQREWRETRKLRRDPRITRFGGILRATSLDELPQLLNILQGQMSLVGPRPVVPAELPRYSDDIAYYLAVKPGLTGLWQVSGRSDTSYQRRVELDVTYVQGWSFWKDISILLQTIMVVALRRGAV